MSAVVSELDVLAACERVASERTDAPVAAFVTWFVGQREGWPVARKRVPTSTWYRHLRLLKKAGIEVPAGSRSKRPAATGVRELDSGAGLRRMVGKRLVLLAAVDRWHLAGTCGTVVQILFRDSEWLVGVQFDGSPGSYEELRVGRFARIVEWIADDVRA
jgi:hypothetical protein